MGGGIIRIKGIDDETAVERCCCLASIWAYDVLDLLFESRKLTNLVNKVLRRLIVRPCAITAYRLKSGSLLATEAGDYPNSYLLCSPCLNSMSFHH